MCVFVGGCVCRCVGVCGCVWVCVCVCVGVCGCVWVWGGMCVGGGGVLKVYSCITCCVSSLSSRGRFLQTVERSYTSCT